MSWFAEDRIEIDHVIPPVGWSGKNPEKSDHTFCSRPNNATKSRGDLSSKLKDMPSTYESPSCDKPSKKSSPSEENISSSSPGSSSVKSSPRCSTTTQCDETKLSQLSGKQPLTKSKSADGNATVSSPTPKRSSEGSSRATVKKRKLSRLSNKRLADMSRKTEDTIPQQPPKLSNDSVAQSAEQSASSSSNGSPTTPSSQFTAGESKEDSLSAANTSGSLNGPSIFSSSKRMASSTTSSSASTPGVSARFQCPKCGLIVYHFNFLFFLQKETNNKTKGRLFSISTFIKSFYQ